MWILGIGTSRRNQTIERGLSGWTNRGRLEKDARVGKDGQGEDPYLASLEEVLRVLRPGGLFGLAEPMHRKGPCPKDLEPLVSEGPLPFQKFLANPEHTAEQFEKAGFEVVEFDHAPDARAWWEEFARYDPECRRNPAGNPRMLAVDDGRWVSFGYVIGRRPS